MSWLMKPHSSLLELLNTFRLQLIEGKENTEVVFWFNDIEHDLVRHFYLERKKILGGKKKKIVLVLDSAGGDINAAYLLIDRACP
jgi:hypothetical protein